MPSRVCGKPRLSHLAVGAHTEGEAHLCWGHMCLRIRVRIRVIGRVRVAELGLVGVTVRRSGSQWGLGDIQPL